LSSLLAKLRAIAEAPASAPPRPWEHKDYAPVKETDDLKRILALPRRPVPSDAEMVEMARSMTLRLRRIRTTPCECARLRPEVVARGQNPCITELRPLQGWYLTEAAEVGGVLGLLPVGSGKTCLDILTAMVVPDCKLAVLLIPPGLREQFKNDYKVWSQHFIVPNLRGGPGPFVNGRPVLEVLAYSELSLPKNTAWFDARPDLSVVLADEAHSLKDRGSTRTHRFLKVLSSRPHVSFFCHSGSITTKRPQDYSHFAAFSLGEGSPLPLDHNVVEEWADALEPDEFKTRGIGALKALAEDGSLREGFYRRLVQTKGVITTRDVGIDTRLTFKTRKPPPMPRAVADALADVRSKEQRPDGEELVDALEVAAVARQVAAGFYLYWAYPRNEPEDLIYEWFAKRQDWNRELRDKLKRRSEHMDSPKLVRDAAIRFASGYEGELPVWESDCWAPWVAIADKVQPVTRVKWIDDWLMRDAAAWGQESPGIIWYENAAVGHLIAELGGFPQFGPGQQASAEILKEQGDRTIVVSSKAHGTGKNLQSFSRNLFVQFPGDAEQTIGRTHRSGQPKEVVSVDFYQHTSEYMDTLNTAMGYAEYVRSTTGSPMRLLLGTWE
jgi:hypothetical protein